MATLPSTSQRRKATKSCAPCLWRPGWASFVWLWKTKWIIKKLKLKIYIRNFKIFKIYFSIMTNSYLDIELSLSLHNNLPFILTFSFFRLTQKPKTPSKYKREPKLKKRKTKPATKRKMRRVTKRKRKRKKTMKVKRTNPIATHP